jgi:hypothetical protein
MTLIFFNSGGSRKLIASQPNEPAIRSAYAEFSVMN